MPGMDPSMAGMGAGAPPAGGMPAISDQSGPPMGGAGAGGMNPLAMVGALPMKRKAPKKGKRHGKSSKRKRSRKR